MRYLGCPGWGCSAPGRDALPRGRDALGPGGGAHPPGEGVPSRGAAPPARPMRWEGAEGAIPAVTAPMLTRGSWGHPRGAAHVEAVAGSPAGRPAVSGPGGGEGTDGKELIGATAAPAAGCSPGPGSPRAGKVRARPPRRGEPRGARAAEPRGRW